MSEPKHLADLLMVALTGGSVTRSYTGEVSLCWENDTRGRSTLSGIVDFADASCSEATACVEWAKEIGVLVIDFYGCPFDKVARWVIKGPMMREQFERVNEFDNMFPAGSAFSQIDTHEWCVKAIEATGCRIYNIPAATEKHNG